MIKSFLSKVGWGELPSSFGFSIGDKVELPFQSQWELHKGQKRSDASPVSVFICAKKDLDSCQVAAAKNAEQMAKSLRHPNILRALDSIEVEGGFYLVTEVVEPLLSKSEPLPGEENEPAVWGLYQALDALQFLHQSGFTHGLFGPSSVFVTPRGEYRLGSFDLCRKGADAASMLAGRKRSGPFIMGWPDPPSSLQENGAPTQAIDFWGAAVMAAYIFGTARTGRPGVQHRLEMARASQDLPLELRKPFQELQRPGPLKGRSPIAEFANLPFFQKHPVVQIMGFLSSLHIRSFEEKEGFFAQLPTLLESVPHGTASRMVLPELLEAQKFPGQEAAQVLPSILKIGSKLKDEDFKEKVAPLVVKLFTSPDRAIRFRLLTSLGDMIDALDDTMINDKIFPECVNGFTDSNGPIREASVKALVHFVPRLKAKTVENRIVKLVVKTLQDPEASIRTNAVICTGRISSSLPKTVASATLMQVIAAGIKDPFGPCRAASLQTLRATASLFSAEELATKLLPSVCVRLIDPEVSVSETAFAVLTDVQQHLRLQIEERRSQSAEAAVAGGAPEAAAAQAAQAASGGWGSWAMSTVGSVVSQKLMTSMGSMGTQGAAPGAAGGGAEVVMPPTASNLGPPRVDSGHSSLGFASAVSKVGGNRPPANSSSSLGLEDDSAAAGAAAWGADEDDDLWDDFDVDAGGGGGGGASKPAAPAAPPPVQVQAAPAPKASAGGGAAAAAEQGRMPRSGMSLASSKPVAKPAPKVTVAKLTSKEEEDFWKEFDM